VPVGILLHAAFRPRLALRSDAQALFRLRLPSSFPASVKKKEKHSKSKQKEKKQKREKQRTKKERGTIRSAIFAPNCFGLASCLFPPLPLFFLSLFLSALVISSICDGFSTLI
jgi:dolichol kinase